jgi:hypothetical protein
MIEEAEKAAQNGRMCNEKRRESKLVKIKPETLYKTRKIVRKDGKNTLKLY